LIDYHRIEYGEFKQIEFDKAPSWKIRILMAMDKILNKRNYSICTFIKDNIPGDFIETGVWRGGAVIFMKALLANAGINNRIVWVADSFEGLPEPDEAKYPADKNDPHHTFKELVISLEIVKKNFEKYNLLDENVKFLKGWFKDTLPIAPIQHLALLRLDGDMYESTMDGLMNLYPKVSKGGFIIIDDWGAVEGCKLAVQDYRTKYGITEEIVPIDWGGVYWRKEK
jgi:O-methyltransferase